ncbi:MAG TPA: 4,5-DOPA dioxygenase extradiol [Hyphomicrobiales bacterium]|nr:4,5-DOPA dioxygenase extradiol [Hyphomicrobiales bacterium]
MNRRSVIQASGMGAVLQAFEPVLAKDAPRMPALFMSHGTPLLAIWDNEYTQGWRELGASLPRPQAILSLSAHWLTRGGVLVTAQERPPMIYDAQGFPPALYDVQYPAPGAPALAAEISGTLTLRSALNAEWGYDHGTWVVLTRLFPDADIPVIQLSLDYDMSPQEQFALGRQLAFLRERGVLIMGSGQFVHNLRLMGSRTEAVEPYDWAVEFSEIVGGWVEQREFAKVQHYRSLGQLAMLAHPTWDHFIPLLNVLGLVDKEDELRWVNLGIMSGSMDMRCLVVG